MQKCPEHSAIEARTTRNEADIQALFSKFGEAISLMYSIDRKLSNWAGKMAGIVLGISTVISLLVVVLKEFIFKIHP